MSERDAIGTVHDIRGDMVIDELVAFETSPRPIELDSDERTLRVSSGLIALRVLSIERVPAPALLHLNDFGREIPIVGYAWLYRQTESQGWTLIDTGMDKVSMANGGRNAERQWRSHPIEQVMKKYGVTFEMITDVVITHLHCDHVGNIGKFPHARWHVPKKDWDFINNARNAVLLEQPIFANPEEVFKEMRVHGVRFLKHGDRPVPGLRMRITGGHTPGSMAVDVFDKVGKLQCVLGGDVMPLAENLKRIIPPGTLWNWGDCIKALKSLARLRVPVLPNHDPCVLEQYSDGVIFQ